MLKPMPPSGLSRCLPLIMFAVLAAGVGGCSTNSGLPQDRADRYTGAPLTSFGGTDGEDPEMRAIARQLCEARDYDFTPVGFQIQPKTTALTELGHADPRFAGGNGQILFSDPPTNTVGTVAFTVLSNDPLVTEVRLSCAFNVRQAQNAINTPGIAFGVNWSITFKLNGVAHSLTADQLLRGVDFRSV
jgi:hypothetical protein